MLKSAMAYLLIIALQLRVAEATCSGYAIETLYGGDEYLHEIKSYLYAMDAVTNDIVVSASGTVADYGDEMFTSIYFIEEESCQVKWHHIFANGHEIEEFSSLAIRSTDNAIYGVMRVSSVINFFRVKTDLGFG